MDCVKLELVLSDKSVLRSMLTANVLLAIVGLHAINVGIMMHSIYSCQLLIHLKTKNYFLLGYFTCPTSGLFPDTAQCSIGRYFYCQQAGAGSLKIDYLFKVKALFSFPILVPVSALCPNNQRFNRFTNQCDRQYQCT